MHVLQAATLRAVAIDDEVFAFKRLNDKVADHSTAVDTIYVSSSFAQLSGRRHTLYSTSEGQTCALPPQLHLKQSKRVKRTY